MSRDVQKIFQFKGVLLKDGWLFPGYVGCDATGIVQYVSAEKPTMTSTIEAVDGYALPGFYNAHSHAFQYLMAGSAETHAADATDDFWTWREAMYKCALSLDPDQIQDVATMLYVELLKKGYTHVIEFHYLHHDKRGKPYSNLAEISVSLLAAAAVAGIRITLIPVFYQKGGFGTDAATSQRRFIFKDSETYFKLFEEAESVAKTMSTARMGFGVHSLRAAANNDIIRIFHEGPRDLPFHLHAAEQKREVEDALHHLQQRPVEWVLDHLPVNQRFSLVHCTHLSDDEVTRLAKTNANVVLCPGTEGNLGDGIFRLADYAKADGKFCIGTDSHISLNPVEDLRWLDYSQRLTSHRRNIFSQPADRFIASSFFSGARASGMERNDFFETDQPLDAVVYSSDAPLLQHPQHLSSKILYTSDPSMITGTIINGRWVIRNGHHTEEESIQGAFSKTVRAVTF